MLMKPQSRGQVTARHPVWGSSWLPAASLLALSAQSLPRPLLLTWLQTTYRRDTANNRLADAVVGSAFIRWGPPCVTDAERAQKMKA